jgi:hypothetical protein
MNWDRILGRQTFHVPCTVEVEHTNEFLGAHVELAGFDPPPGDEVLVHDAPTDVPFGERVVCEREATVKRGGWLDRIWARLAAAPEITELYDISFTPRREL